jgi:hypothetical protein
MKLQSIACLTLLVFFTSCGINYPTADEGVYFQDFDNLKMWGGDQWNLTNEKAHSGSYAARTDSTYEYSQTFSMDFKEAKSKGYKAIEVSAWVFVTNADAKAGIIASVESSAGSTAYMSADVKDFITAPNQWEKGIVFLKLPETAPEGAKIKVYLWSPNKAKIFIDDVTVQFHK